MVTDNFLHLNSDSNNGESHGVGDWKNSYPTLKKIMKKLFLLLTFVTSCFFVQAQDSKVYTIKKTEWYLYNESTEEWDLQTQNNNVNIDLVSYKNVLNIQAKTPTLYRLDESSKKTINGKSYSGLRYSAIECVNMEKCTVDIVFLNDSPSNFLLSVITDYNDKKINLRYYAIIE